MRIACLGWGSLVWNPGRLPVLDTWHGDGPELPLEFARQSRDGRMTLVVVPRLPTVPTLWAATGVQSLEDAKIALAAREGIPAKNIHRDIGFCNGRLWSNHEEGKSIAAWAASKGIDAVVWTALPPQFDKIRGRVPSVDEVVSYLRGLDGEMRSLAEQYVRLAPPQIRTPYRTAIEQSLKWDAVKS